MRFLNGAALGAILLTPAAAFAQAAPATQPQTGAAAPAAAAPTVGATIYDSAGVVVGTVEQVTPQAVVVNMGAAKVALPPSAIGKGTRGLQVSITKAEVEAAARQAQAGSQQQLASQLTAGAEVRGTGGAVVGTVKSSDAQYVTLTTTKGDVKLPISGFTAGPNGAVVGMTAAQLDAAITQAGGGAAASGSTTTSSSATTTSTTGGTDAAATTDASAAGTESGSATTTTTTQTKKTTKRNPR